MQSNSAIGYLISAIIISVGLFLVLRPQIVQRYYETHRGPFGPHPHYSLLGLRIVGLAFCGFGFYVAYMVLTQPQP